MRHSGDPNAHPVDRLERCPYCGSKTEQKGSSNTLGTQSVTWIECKGCNATNPEQDGWKHPSAIDCSY